MREFKLGDMVECVVAGENPAICCLTKGTLYKVAKLQDNPRFVEVVDNEGCLASFFSWRFVWRYHDEQPEQQIRQMRLIELEEEP